MVCGKGLSQNRISDMGPGLGCRHGLYCISQLQIFLIAINSTWRQINKNNNKFLVLALLVCSTSSFVCVGSTHSLVASLASSGVYVCGKKIYSPSSYRRNNSGLKFVKLRGCVSVPAVSRSVCDVIKSYSLWNEIIIKGVTQILNNQFHFWDWWYKYGMLITESSGSMTAFGRWLMFKDFVLTTLFSYSNNLVTQFGDILAEMLVSYLKIVCSI